MSIRGYNANFVCIDRSLCCRYRRYFEQLKPFSACCR